MKAYAIALCNCMVRLIPSIFVSRDQQQDFSAHQAVGAGTPVVSISQVLAAGVASVGAATVTSQFGVAGTILGAALTTMIITGGAAIIKSYFEKIGGHVRSVPVKLRGAATRRGTNQLGRPAVYGRRRFRRKSVLVAALVPAVIAFFIAMTAVTGTELAAGKTLSCMVWDECYTASSGNGGDVAATGPSSSLGVALSKVSQQNNQQPQVVDPQQQQQVPGAGEDVVQPSDPSGESGGGFFEPAAPDQAPQDPATPLPDQPEQPPAQEPLPEQQPPVEPVVPESPVQRQPAQPAVPSGEQVQPTPPEQ